MTPIPNRLKLAGFFAVVTFVAVVGLAKSLADQTELQRAIAIAHPGVLEVCSKISVEARGTFTEGKMGAVLKECLFQLDPTYSAGRETAMCQQAKVTGMRPELFSAEFQKNCFGNE